MSPADCSSGGGRAGAGMMPTHNPFPLRTAVRSSASRRLPGHHHAALRGGGAHGCRTDTQQHPGRDASLETGGVRRPPGSHRWTRRGHGGGGRVGGGRMPASRRALDAFRQTARRPAPSRPSPPALMSSWRAAWTSDGRLRESGPLRCLSAAVRRPAFTQHTTLGQVLAPVGAGRTLDVPPGTRCLPKDRRRPASPGVNTRRKITRWCWWCEPAPR